MAMLDIIPVTVDEGTTAGRLPHLPGSVLPHPSAIGSSVSAGKEQLHVCTTCLALNKCTLFMKLMSQEVLNYLRNLHKQSLLSYFDTFSNSMDPETPMLRAGAMLRLTHPRKSLR